MSKFKIVTDSTADLPVKYIEEKKLSIVHLSYIIDGETYTGDKQLGVKDFYDKMRKGMMPTTSQANPEDAKVILEAELKECKEILCIAFSSGLSGTCNSFRIAAQELMEEDEEAKIIVVDTLSASLGEGLLVHKAIKLQEEGKSLEETANWIEAHKLHLVHAFTVDDLFHLHRGGRVSKATAIVGSMINIKPILHVDNEGHLTALSKVRGRKKSLHALVDYMGEKMGDFQKENDTIFISHGDCLEDAMLVKEEIEKRFGIKDFLINEVGPTIGAHSGPGTLALFFFGESR
ncbi:MAG: DegV family protein [Lachnospiraceae bacterium]|nr:DegV family protein [Lachnospiraceae bacterium]